MGKIRRYLQQSRFGIRTIRNFFLDMRYGAFLGGSIKTRHQDRGATNTANTDYSVMSQLFDGQIEDSDVLVDVGCGKGRVINWWLMQGFNNKILGIELDRAIAERTRKRLRKYKNVQIIAGDVIEKLPEEGTFFYIFNSFNMPVVEMFKQRLEDMFHEKRNIKIIYYNPKHIGLFECDSLWEVEKFKIDGVDRTGRKTCAIIRMNPGG